MHHIFKTLLLLILGFGVQAQSFDTTGMAAWPQRYNSYTSWDQGAFDAYRDTSDPADFGWGNYNVTTHLISGDSIYILKTVQGNYKAISIDNISSGTYTITYSNLNGSAQTTKSFSRANYSSRNFFYYAIDQDVVKDLEPNSADWDIVFTKYPIIFPGFGAYPVAGVLHNRGVATAKVEKDSGMIASISDTLQFPMLSEINQIGYDWKDAFAGVVHDTLSYFVKDQLGNINQLQFTEYGGSATGIMKFTVNGLLDSVVLGAGNSDQVYYSLQNRNQVALNSDHDWDLAFFAQSSFEAIPIRINDVQGAELRVYPTKDISHWTSIGLEESPLQVLSVYPNPAKDVLHLALNLNRSEDLEIRMYNANGQLCLNRKLKADASFQELVIDLDELNQGIYQVQILGAGFGASTAVLVQP